MRRRAQIGRPDRRRNRYPLASAEGFFNTIDVKPPLIVSSELRLGGVTANLSAGMGGHTRIVRRSLVSALN
jgi:hypothetical protein